MSIPLIEKEEPSPKGKNIYLGSIIVLNIGVNKFIRCWPVASISLEINIEIKRDPARIKVS